jgi:hypothetical protein
MAKHVATLTVSYDPSAFSDEAGQSKITLQQMTTRFDGEGFLYARCFPSDGVSFKASAGSVTTAEAIQQSVNEGLKFSNSSRSALKFAGASNVAITPFILMKKVKDQQGNVQIVEASDVRLRYDQETNEVVAESGVGDEIKSIAIYGACFVTYHATYRVLNYKPGMVKYPRGGVLFQIGTIFGYNNQDVATLDMELDLSSAPDWIEYARVTSKVVLDAEGTHEAPIGWPENTQHDNGKELDPDNSFTDERLHCIVHINTAGRLRYEDFSNGGSDYWAWFDPKFGYSTWDPEYQLKLSDPPGGTKANSAEDFKYDLNNRTWRDVFLDVDKDEVLEKLNLEYPGIIEGQKGGNY